MSVLRYVYVWWSICGDCNLKWLAEWSQYNNICVASKTFLDTNFTSHQYKLTNPICNSLGTLKGIVHKTKTNKTGKCKSLFKPDYIQTGHQPSNPKINSTIEHKYTKLNSTLKCYNIGLCKQVYTLCISWLYSTLKLVRPLKSSHPIVRTF